MATKHGYSRTRLYRIWKAMLHRCENPKHMAFSSYGGCGIRVCKAWHDFLTFRSWALTHSYSDNLSIDRIKNGLGYWPSNCRWATRVEQRRNQRRYQGIADLREYNRMWRAKNLNKRREQDHQYRIRAAKKVA